MKRNLRLLVGEVEHKFGKKINWKADFNELLSLFRKCHLTLDSLSPRSKDRLALLAGYPSWRDFQEALSGDADGQANYDIDEK